MSVSGVQGILLRDCRSAIDSKETIGIILKSLTTFRRKLKTHLFRQSYPDIVL